MSRIVRLKPGAWPAQPLTPEVAEGVVAGGAARADAMADMAASVRRLSWIVGGGGMLTAAIAVGAAAWVLVSDDPPRHHFSTFDEATGRVEAAISATDAPRLFNTGTAHQYLRMFVETCASYVHDMRARNYSRCTALMAPQAQAKYRDLFTATNPDSPQNRIGRAATLSPEGLRYSRIPAGGGRIQSWIVRYTQVEHRNGQKVGQVPMAVTVHFEWRPDMRMTQEQREWNTAGMRVVDFSFGADVGS